MVQFKEKNKLIKCLFSNRAFGLVEALIALAVVSTGMVLITALSLKSIKQARKTEMEDVAIQSGVEVMDFIKQPFKVKLKKTNNSEIKNGQNHYFFLSTDPNNVALVEKNATTKISSCKPGSSEYSSYGVEYIEDFSICQQIVLQYESSSNRFFVTAVIIWDSVDGTQEKREFTGYRLGSVEIVN